MGQSYLHNTSRTPGAAAETATENKTAKYAPLVQSYLFDSIAVETMAAINSDGLEFLDDLGRRITQVTDDIRESAFLFQRRSVLIQRYNSVAIPGIFAHATPENEL